MLYYEAKNIAASYEIPLFCDFHALNSDTVERILSAANSRRYRKPRSANGSRARYFYAYLNRAATRAPVM